MSPTREQLIKALYNEYAYLCHDDFDPKDDMSIEEYLVMLNELDYDALVEETGTDESFTLEDFINAYV